MKNIFRCGVGLIVLALASIPAQANSAEAENHHIVTESAIAQEPLAVPPLDAEETDTATMEQVTSVDQLSDIPPGHWAQESLVMLSERYNCLPAPRANGKFRGDRALTRYEFAAAFKACLDTIDKFLAEQVERKRNPEELVILKRLNQEFEQEIARTAESRLDPIGDRIAFLENHQFSTTTKLFGQVIVGVQGRSNNTRDISPRDGIKETADSSTQINVISNVQLGLISQFPDNSILFTGLQSGNGSTDSNLINDVRLGYEDNTNNSLKISDLSYRFYTGKKFAITVGPAGVNAITVFRGQNRFETAGSGPISAFAQRNPILSIGSGNGGNGSGGIGFDWQMDPRVSMQGIFSAATPGNQGNRQGLFNGGYATGLQLTLNPANKLDTALYYIHAYSPLGFLGTQIGDDQLAGKGFPLLTNAVGASANWQIAPEITLGTWGGYSSSFMPGLRGTVETTNWMAYINFPDLFGRGNLGGIYVGQPPKITGSNLPTGFNVPGLLNNSVGSPGGEPGTTTHVEAFYRWQINDNISITPGFLLIFQPRHTPASDNISVGLLRTTFQF